jgi:hypothetical protein
VKQAKNYKVSDSNLDPNVLVFLRAVATVANPDLHKLGALTSALDTVRNDYHLCQSFALHPFGTRLVAKALLRVQVLREAASFVDALAGFAVKLDKMLVASTACVASLQEAVAASLASNKVRLDTFMSWFKAQWQDTCVMQDVINGMAAMPEAVLQIPDVAMPMSDLRQNLVACGLQCMKACVLTVDGNIRMVADLTAFQQNPGDMNTVDQLFEICADMAMKACVSIAHTSW